MVMMTLCSPCTVSLLVRTLYYYNAAQSDVVWPPCMLLCTVNGHQRSRPLPYREGPHTHTQTYTPRRAHTQCICKPRVHMASTSTIIGRVHKFQPIASGCRHSHETQASVDEVPDNVNEHEHYACLQMQSATNTNNHARHVSKKKNTHVSL
jgi:hypothetical protein